MYEKKRVYVLVKTYPTISNKYAELVCTAGVLEDGSWIRLYPMPFRLLEDDQKFKKYTWIDVEVERNTADFRPESYRPNLSSVFVHNNTSKADWEERRKIIFKNKIIYKNLHKLIDESRKNPPNSLAIFKPTKILDFKVNEVEREWNKEKIESLHNESLQLNLFKTVEEVDKEFKVVRKLPYKFSYNFIDDEGTESTLMIEDWEIGMLYFNCLKKSNGDEKKAIEDVKQKYFIDFVNKKDLYFFLGTTKANHYVSKNPFIIIGVFYPPKQSENLQISFFD